MALTLAMNDSNFNISSGINLAYITHDGNDSGGSPITKYKFRYLLDLTYTIDNNGTLPTTKTVSFTQQQNQDGAGIFSLSEIYQSTVSPMIVSRFKADAPATTVPNQYASIHNMPNDNTAIGKLFSWGVLSNAIGMEAFKGNANVMNLKFYEMYATTSGGIPTKQVWSEKEKTIFMMWGRGQEDEGVVIDFSQYELDGTSKKFLSSNYNNVSTDKFNINIGANEYHTIAFLNRCAINTSADTYRIKVQYFDSANSSLGSLYLNNTTTSGGAYYTTASDGEDESFYLYAGIGLDNLQKIDTSEASYSGTLPDSVAGGRSAIAYYVVKIQTSAGVDMSARYDFTITSYCDRYEQSRLAYMNRFGAWEYITLNREKTEELKIKRESITKPLINQASSFAQFGDAYLNSVYPLDVAKQGTMTTSVKGTETFTLFTDNLKDYEIEQIKDLMLSPQIHLLDGANAKALMLETSNMKLKGDKNTGLFKYELKFKYANPKHRQTLS